MEEKYVLENASRPCRYLDPFSRYKLSKIKMSIDRVIDVTYFFSWKWVVNSKKKSWLSVCRWVVHWSAAWDRSVRDVRARRQSKSPKIMIYFDLRYLENDSSYRDKTKNVLKGEFRGSLWHR